MSTPPDDTEGLREQTEAAAIQWVASCPLPLLGITGAPPSRTLAESSQALAESWGREITAAVWAVVSPALERQQAEIDLLRETLAETDLGAQVLAQWEAIAAADADRDRMEAQVAALQKALADRGDDVLAFQKACGTHLPEQARKIRAERDALKAAIVEQTQRTLNAAADKLCALPATDGAALKGPYWYRQGFLQAADLLRDWADYPAALDTPSTPSAPPKPGIDGAQMPDRIDYDDDDELDDVVVNDCDAHLERLDTGRWYLGLYGKDGRTLTIDIASKTGRAEVTGFVTYSEGFEDGPETPSGES